MWDDPKALSGIAVTLTAMACAALAAATLGWIARLPAFEIREVAIVTPLVRASAPHIETAIRDELHGTFFTMDLEAARSAIAKAAWVRSVSIRRSWPHRLEVSIDEHAPLARWNETALVNTFGERFFAQHGARLPQFNGPDGYATEMTQRYREWSGMLQPLGVTVAGIDLTPRGGWRLHASAAEGPLTLELGRDDPSGRLERFVVGYGRTLGTLARAGTRIEHVDLRYRNGFAARVPGFRESTARKTP